MSYETRVINQRIDGEPPDRYFRCEVEVFDNATGNVEARKTLNWRMRGPKVTQTAVQNYVDRVKSDLLSDVREAARFDPTEIT